MRRQKRKTQPAAATKPAAANLTDDVMAMFALLNTHPFVQKVFLSKGKSPTIEQQLADMRRFCCASDANGTRSVLGVDRTFNLGPCFVTVVVYKCRAVVRNDSRSHPTFVGPMFQH